jgi:hypothetical protein
VNNLIGFINGNKKIIISILFFTIFSVIIIKYNLFKNQFTAINYISLALIGQLVNCIILICILLSLFFMPLIVLTIFHLALSQTYLYGIFEGIGIPIIINIFIVLLMTILIFIIIAFFPIIYTEKAILKYDPNINIMDNKIIFINPLKTLMKILKLRNIIKKCQNVA